MTKSSKEIFLIVGVSFVVALVVSLIVSGIIARAQFSPPIINKDFGNSKVKIPERLGADLTIYFYTVGGQGNCTLCDVGMGVGVINEGNARAEETITRIAIFNESGFVASDEIETPSLPSEESFFAISRWFELYEGSYYFVASADYYDNVHELNELNNNVTVHFNV